ncbi:hypothetical protein OAJ95_00950 [Pelagibacteraceae bacterium]|nr:hypothetical protein [Pelagibacteraceae bacterium]
MNKILFIIILFISPLTLADVNLKKFSIEGISIGDSVANYFPGREITKNIVKQPDLTDEFYVAHFNKHKSFSKFDQIYFVINPSTENVLFSIEGMSAFIDFKQDIEKCFKEKDSFFEQIVNIYKQEINEKLIDINTAIKIHPSDLTGKSTYEQTDIKFPNGFIRIACYDMRANSETNDALILDFFTEDVDRWLQNESKKT